jgi:hypothetical protein
MHRLPTGWNENLAAAVSTIANPVFENVDNNERVKDESDGTVTPSVLRGAIAGRWTIMPPVDILRRFGIRRTVRVSWRVTIPSILHCYANAVSRQMVFRKLQVTQCWMLMRNCGCVLVLGKRVAVTDFRVTWIAVSSYLFPRYLNCHGGCHTSQKS